MKLQRKKKTEKNNISVVKTKYDDSSFNKFKNERAQYVEVLEKNSVVKTEYDDSSFNKFKNERAQYVEVLESEIQR